jgi:thioredoxin-related protein
MKSVTLFFFLASFICTTSITAQTIQLEFPFFAGNTYEFKIVQGNKEIVLQNDTIPMGGKVTLTIPKKYKGYKGMAMWYITNSKNGGGLDLVINNENFSVTCLDSIPTAKNIEYKNTKENIFSSTNYQEQQAIFAKLDGMMHATRAYDKNHPLYSVFEKEYAVIVEAYNQYVQRLNNTDLYAARFREITNITMGIGSIITQDENLKAKNINDIIVNQLDFEVVYTSNHWGGIINNWVLLQTMILKDDKQMIKEAQILLNRMPNNQIYTDFVAALTYQLTKLGKDNIIAVLTPEIKASKKLQNYNDHLSIYQKDLSGKAPNLEIMPLNKDKKGIHKTKTIDLAKQKTNYSLLVFYQSGCGPCEELMEGLQANFKELTTKGVEIITLSADTDEAFFKNTAAQHPWTQKYCDLQGVNGVNFKNYAVLGTPTLFLIDKKGMILQKMSGMEELLAWSKSLRNNKQSSPILSR